MELKSTVFDRMKLLFRYRPIQSDEPLELANAISSVLDNKALRRKLAANARRSLFGRYYKGRITLKEV